MINKQGSIRIVASWALVFILILGIMTPTASAAATTVLGVSSERFFADTLYFSNGRGELNENGSVALSFDGGEPSVAMDIAKRISSDANSIRVVIDNVSLCDTMVVEYITQNKTADVPLTRTVECEIIKGDGAKEYIIPIENASGMTSLRISFKGAVRGEITLVSIGFVSYHSDTREYCGELEKSEYDQNTKTAVIQGSVSWDCVSKNPDAKIVVYKLSQDQTLENIEGVHSYIAWSDISLNFSIKLDVKKTVDAYSQYALAVLTDDGRVLPIAHEFYLNAKKFSDPIKSPDGFKGTETSLYGGVVDGNGEIAYVNVCLGKLFGNEENGFQYMVDGTEYYVDNVYVSELDALINAYRISGIDVYLRLVVDGECEGELFGSGVDQSGAKYYAVDIYDENIFAKFTAYAEYVIARYAGVSGSNVKGVVFGRSLDAFAEYNRSDKLLSLDEYSRRLAKMCAVVRGMLDKYGNGLELILPFSDAKFGVESIITDPKSNGCYPIDILASSLLEYARGYNVDLEGMRFMLESSCAPVGKNNADAYEAIGNCAAFENMLLALNEKYSELPVEFIYCWYAGGERVFNNYVYNYIVAANTAGVRSFVVSLADIPEKERDAIAEMSTVYKFIDTSKSEQVIGETMRALGLASWGELIEEFEQSKLVKQDLTRIELRNSLPNAIIGSYNMWDFERNANASGWQALSCEKVSVGAVEGGASRALTLLMSKEKAEEIGSSYSSAVYSHENLMKVTGISGISFDVFVPKSEQEKIYEVVITIKSEDSSTEFSGVIFSGSEATLYADIQNIDVVKSIEISTRDLSGAEDEAYKLYIRNIAIHSNEYGDSVLEKLVVSGSITDGGARNDVESEELAEMIVIAVIIVSLMLIWGVWLFYKASKAI